MGKHKTVHGTDGTSRPLSRHQMMVRDLSERLVQALRPIRVLDAVKWDGPVEAAFFAEAGRELPRVTRHYYQTHPLAFDPHRKKQEFRDLERDIRRRLGTNHAAGRLLWRRCQEGRAVLDLLAQRGTPGFAAVSSRLYGSAGDLGRAAASMLTDLGQRMCEHLPGASHASTHEGPELDATQAMRLLTVRLADYFRGEAAVRVRLSDDILADATAGTDYIKLRGDARFRPREVRLLEVHEGWVHLGTTVNGQRQPVCTFLAKGTPSATVTQEGLAVLTEVLALASHPGRVRRLTQRVEAVARAEAGANFLEIYRFFLDQGCTPRESYHHATRVFRGSLPEGCGPFTKDLAYSTGFLLVSEFVRAAVAGGEVRRVPLLFCGKTSLADLADLAQLHDEGMIEPPRHLPPPFTDLSALAKWAVGTGLATQRLSASA